MTEIICGLDSGFVRLTQARGGGYACMGDMGVLEEALLASERHPIERDRVTAKQSTELHCPVVTLLALPQ